MNGEYPIRSGAMASWWLARVAAITSSRSASICRAPAINTSAAGVTLTPFRTRTRSSIERASSMDLSWELRDGCATKRRLAARVIFPSSATAIKYLRCLNLSRVEMLSRSALRFLMLGESFKNHKRVSSPWWGLRLCGEESRKSTAAII